MQPEIYLYHAMPLAQVKRGLLIPDPSYSDEEYLPAYRWLERETGFFPLFLAVGTVQEAVYVTGYSNQWRVYIGGEPTDGGSWRKLYRKAGEFPNYVLFALPLSALAGNSEGNSERTAKDSFSGVFTDYQWWNIVLTDCMNGTAVGQKLRRTLFKKSWARSKWLSTAAKDGHLVQVVAPQIDLDRAAFVWARNQETAKTLRQMGFANVQVKRLPLEIS